MSNKFLQLLAIATSEFKEESTFIENNLTITRMVKVDYSIPTKHILHVGIGPHNHRSSETSYAHFLRPSTHVWQHIKCSETPRISHLEDLIFE